MKKTVYWIEGDGIGKEIWQAARPVIDAALARESDDCIEWDQCGLDIAPTPDITACAFAITALTSSLRRPNVVASSVTPVRQGAFLSSSTWRRR